VVLLKVLSIYILVLIGFIAAKAKILPKESGKYLSNVVLYIACPCSIVHSMAEQEMNVDNAVLIGFLSVGIVVLFAAALGVSIIFTKIFKVPFEGAGIYQNMITFPNNGFMGMPVGLSLYGPTGFFYVVCSNITFPFMAYTYGVWNLTHRMPGAQKMSLKSLLNMPVISSVIGLVIFFTSMPLPDFFMDTIEIAAGSMTPLCMMVIGIQLTESSLKSVIKNYRLLVATIFKLLIVPAVSIALVIPFSKAYSPIGVFDNLQATCLALNMVMPTAAVTVILSEMYGSDVRLAAEGAFLTTALSIATIPLFAGIMQSIFPL
jgi:predicted permease